MIKLTRKVVSSLELILLSSVWLASELIVGGYNWTKRKTYEKRDEHYTCTSHNSETLFPRYQKLK